MQSVSDNRHSDRMLCADFTVLYYLSIFTTVRSYILSKRNKIFQFYDHPDKHTCHSDIYGSTAVAGIKMGFVFSETFCSERSSCLYINSRNCVSFYAGSYLGSAGT